MDSDSTLPCVMWVVVPGVQGYPVKGYYNTWWLMGLGSTQEKMEGIMLKVARHWGSDCSVVNNPLGEPGCTLLYVGLPTMWGSVDSDQILSPFFMGGLFIGDYDGYK